MSKNTNTKTIKFSREYPLNGGAMTDTITMREPTVGDEINAQETAPKESLVQITLFANLCDLTLDELKQISSKDGQKIAEAYNSFLE